MSILFVLTYFKLFWLIAIAGVVLVAIFLKHRRAGNLRSVIAFVGIFVVIYGVLGQVILWLM